jgi:hypothetical protein
LIGGYVSKAALLGGKKISKYSISDAKEVIHEITKADKYFP